jgi:hypothetical protein
MRRSNEEEDKEAGLKETRLSSQHQYNHHATPLPDMQDHEACNMLRDIKGSNKEVTEPSEILQKKLLDGICECCENFWQLGGGLYFLS